MGPTLYEVERIGNGFLAVMAKPVAGEWVDEEFAGIAAAGIKQVVSLLEPAEAHEVGLDGEASLCARHGIGYHSYPLVDRGLPPSVSGFAKFTWERFCDIAEGLNTVVHCRAGIGRAGIVAAGILLHAGFKPKAAFAQISKARGVKVPDTQEQYRWLAENQHDVEAMTYTLGWTPEQEMLMQKLSAAEIDDIDRCLLANAIDQWRKVAFVVGKAMNRRGAGTSEIPDTFYAQRIKSLADRGLVESQGDLRRMRFSEVRLPKDRS